MGGQKVSPIIIPVFSFIIPIEKAMRFKYQDFILFLIVLFGFACQSDPEISRPQLPYHFIDFVKYSVDCEQDSIRCAVFKAKYPEKNIHASGQS